MCAGNCTAPAIEEIMSKHKKTIEVRPAEFVHFLTNELTLFEDLIESGHERVREIEDTDGRGGKKYTIIYKLVKVIDR
jgi:hypothetical protein